MHICVFLCLCVAKSPRLQADFQPDGLLPRDIARHHPGRPQTLRQRAPFCCSVVFCSTVKEFSVSTAEFRPLLVMYYAIQELLK